ncbi:MAG: gliding motility-associated C-terminal domain-containing protein [Schleiferiaceae bacterium]|nr:gliding motility-associated C-terminal domain-containing protein [Schleiferiaceae bacterium]
MIVQTKLRLKNVGWTRVYLYLLFMIIGCFSNVLNAQSDTYFALPPLYEWQGGQHTIDLQFSASSTTSNVWIYNSDTSYSQNLVVTPGALVTTSLTNIIGGLSSTYGARELTWSNSKRYKDALFIEASQPVTVTERVKHQFNQDIITGKGSNGIGTDFYVASQTLILSTVTGSYTGYYGKHYVSLVALEDSTDVVIKAQPGNVFDNGSDSVVFTLNQGQSWVSTMADDDVLLGTRVTSTKPIAVTAGGNHLKNSSGNPGDGGIDQVTPVEHLGLKHVVLRGRSTYPQDYFMYVATENGTNISVDGVSVLTNGSKGASGTYSLSGNANPGKPYVVESNLPIYVFQVTTGVANGSPEQGMAQLPHIDCTGSTFIRYSRASGLTTSALVTIPSNAVANLNYNGTAVLSNTNITVQQSTYDPAWSGVYIGSNVLSNNFTLDCTTPFHLGILAGQGSSTGLYGYISGFDDDFKLLDPFTALPVNDVPLGNLCATPIPLYFSYLSCVDSINVISSSILQGPGTVVDSNANDTLLHVIMDPAYTGTVRVKVLVEDGRGYTDSLFYDFEYFGTSYEPILLDSATVCSTQPIVLQVENLGAAMGVSYLWSNGDTTSTTTVYDPGWAWVTVDLGDCLFTDSIFLENGSLFEPPYSDTAYCDSLFVDFNDPLVTQIYWITLDTTTTELWLDSAGIYPYIATDINGCESQDSLNFRLIPEPYIDEGFGCPNYTLTAIGYTAFIAMELGGISYSSPQIDTLFPFAGSHDLTLIALDSCNNLDTISRVLEVDCLDNMLMYVPTAFSPNGDGLNDTYCISSSLPTRTTYTIFDRWGNELFSGRADECWDPIALGQEVFTSTLSMRTFTRLPSNELHIDEFTIHVLP